MDSSSAGGSASAWSPESQDFFSCFYLFGFLLIVISLSSCSPGLRTNSRLRSIAPLKSLSRFLLVFFLFTGTGLKNHHCFRQMMTPATSRTWSATRRTTASKSVSVCLEKNASSKEDYAHFGRVFRGDRRKDHLQGAGPSELIPVTGDGNLIVRRDWTLHNTSHIKNHTRRQ